MITSIGREAERLTRTVIYTDGARRADRTVGASCGSNCVLIDRKCNMDRVVRRVVRERIVRGNWLRNTIHDHTIHMVSGAGSEAEELARTVVYADGARWADRTVGASCGSNCVLIDRKSNMDRVVRRVVRERIVRGSWLRNTINDHTIHMVSGAGSEAEELARTVVYADGARWADRP